MPSMDYNPRMSMARGSQQSSQQKRTKEDESDAFMTLPDKEIAGCISDIGIAFSLEDLRKPNPQQIQRIFEWFAELLTNTTRDVVSPAMRAAAEDMYGDDADRVFSADTRELMGFFITMRRLLLECGIKDFTFSDLYKPTHPRLVKIFSYIINFIRFRESQTSVIDEHYNSSERTKNIIEELYHENQEKEERLQEMQQNRKNVEQAIADKERRNQELKTRLLELKKAQERVTEKLERVKGEQGRFKNVLEERTTSVMNMRQEANKLRPYTEQSPAVLEQSLRDLSGSLNADRSEIDRLDRRSRALQTSCDTFNVLISDIGSLSRLLNDLQAELQKEEEEGRAAAKNREALTEASNSVREVERQERILRKQLEQWQSRTDKLRRDAETKANNARAKMESLRSVHKELTAERRERGEEVEKRRIRIEQVEKKMADLKENIEHEVQSAREEYMKMESHIRLYITEMEQSI
ncbi:kinetochore protein nuf2 [Hortaea werneckii]|uniref:Probable kinetochore protein NUF2 n=1 Tax=Hortaea werneckii TaxID=91943 RepID=A0A3M7G1D9_HORWE|nr:kinetochore protein nuf2 [Hortaea werneckii]KAI6862098.1 kinetochore protein nuf2 [Hortaea werneckii]KAI7218132.1 kinetochore protein nuf2 [Hortaea werneckii]KAI7572668.1 kinetochore protein nuf2 [Hortaea werneckii]KAI7615287.1 kinetochore protein nuf2 [Hortaea werneckii]